MKTREKRGVVLRAQCCCWEVHVGVRETHLGGWRARVERRRFVWEVVGDSLRGQSRHKLAHPLLLEKAGSCARLPLGGSLIITDSTSTSTCTRARTAPTPHTPTRLVLSFLVLSRLSPCRTLSHALVHALALFLRRCPGHPLISPAATATATTTATATAAAGAASSGVGEAPSIPRDYWTLDLDLDLDRPTARDWTGLDWTGRHCTALRCCWCPRFIMQAIRRATLFALPHAWRSGAPSTHHPAQPTRRTVHYISPSLCLSTECRACSHHPAHTRFGTSNLGSGAAHAPLRRPEINRHCTIVDLTLPSPSAAQP